MGSSTIPVLLVTANVGSIFEDPTTMLKVWSEEFLSTVSKLDPKFIALHCQEVGGKNYELSMKHVENFVKLLMSSNELRLFDKIRVFLDEDYSSAENFTALGNLYFIHKSLDNNLIWDFKEMKFIPVLGKEIHSGNIEAVVTKEKAKFPQDFFPECKWSRKGFMRTRWSLNGTVIDMVNIHLFHDASNFVAMESYPSVYCKNRRRALEHTLQRFHNDPYAKAPFFLFGDFNFRTDTDGVVKKLTAGLKPTRVQNNKNNESTKVHYTNGDSKLVLTVGKKEFNHSDHQTVFLNPTPDWLKSFDKELEAFENALTEYPVTFPPSYPFEEKLAKATSYMQTRCPAWCDRVLLSRSAKQLVSEDYKVDYGLIGINTCMGDHKPVYLKMDLKGNAGIGECEMNSLKIAESKVKKVEDIMDPSGVTRYIYIQNIDNPIKMFRETAV
ncbi:type I inositol 1,4,5-trisphosphate 5-phosphatase isoform X2 [Anoplophora glabripennis]|uniref:type I inositol 1,4,5-trisphosphate 5-phosphatase isoform X2 n=1 Tax=Anoplophora glabripennis TaxID=217634 RepID=UPI000874118D|nr:type I inositol 1,4,5-trisphosphate 5-phosphatase isoform X2 [Anoplophora glabripennis]